MTYAAQPKQPNHYGGGLSKYMISGANLGSVFYVDGCSGSVTNTGLTPESPLDTIAGALALCTNDHNDTIVVLDYYDLESDLAITINKSKVTLVGSEGGAIARPWTCLHATADTACLIVAANDVRIHQLYFDAGASHGGIEFSGGKCRIGIYDCYFGTGAYGVYDATGGVAFSLEVANCFFQQSLTGHSLYINDDPAHCFFHHNYFDQAQGDAINIVQGGGDRVCDNTIACGADAQGRGITLGASVTRCLCARNVANFGDTDMATNPFEDGAAAGTNHWMANYKGITLIQPA
jgi:hypothetical protein